MSSNALTFLATFIASAVEAVEALTIVLAVGVVRGWRSTLVGVGAASLVLAAIVAALGPALQHIPIDDAPLRRRRPAARLRPAVAAQGDPARERLQATARRGRGVLARARARPARPRRPGRRGMDWYSFTVAFKGVLLEGLEVAFIVVTLRRDAGAARAGRRRGRGRGRARGRRRPGGARAARARAREHAQVRRRPAARRASASSGAARAPASTGRAATLAILGVIGFVGLVSFVLTRALRRRWLALQPAAAQG